MLAELRVRDYALIENLTLELGPGLTVMTGETGAGKSIILGALSLVLGEKPDPEMVRSGADFAVVEARFTDAESVAGDCAELGIDLPDGELILRRRAAREGRGSAHANDSAITVEALRRLGDRLVDLHGQHQHQYLLRAETHLDLLDAHARLRDERARYAERHAGLERLRTELAGLEAELARRRERRELTEYQVRELADAAPEPGEHSALLAERELLASSEARYTIARRLEELLSEQEGSVAELLGAVESQLVELARLDDSARPRLEAATGARAVLDDLWRELTSYREAIQFSPERLEEVNARLFRLEKLERKYGVAPDELGELAAKLARELESLETGESRLDELRRQVEAATAALLELAAALSRKRARAGKVLEASLAKEFPALGLERAVLSVRHDRPDRPGPADLGPTGFDDVEFLFCANPGEELKPLRKVASGGELSRVMLSLKNALSGVAVVPTMVFDEIDTGIGGRVAEAVGRRLELLGRNQQVICITHLPQIARFAAHHFLVSKSVRRGRTVTSITRLDDEERVAELARMSGGEQVTETTLAHARELLERAGRSPARRGR
ncbi:DNA repair protein RecN [candidate division WOR-3 bacterium]|nr:DNA repair protein RecN [candidate division WOR-3 bacterium]